MNLPATSPTDPPASLVERLGAVAETRGLAGLAERLVQLGQWIGNDMQGFEIELATLAKGPSAIERAGKHLLDLGGKHLRPMCVLLCARLGGEASDAARDLAVAVELVHSATLLHDDVVDTAGERRGAQAARVLYGNAASIFAGDWLLVQALIRIQRAGHPGLTDRMLRIIDEMILAESVQLENRGRVNADMGDYFAVVEGKTASLFRWAMFAGGVAGHLPKTTCEALDRFGLHLGVAFQAVDDLLDLDGNPHSTGKALYADLREGKMTYPLIVALERRPSVLPAIERCIELGEELTETDAAPVLDAMRQTGAVDACRQLADARATQAIRQLGDVEDGPGKNALITIATAAIHRSR